MVAYPIYPWIRWQYKIRDLSNNCFWIRHKLAKVVFIYCTTKCTPFVDTMVIQYRVHICSDRLTKWFRILISFSLNLKSILGLCQAVLAYFDVFLQIFWLFFTFYNSKRSISWWFTSIVLILSFCCRKPFYISSVVEKEVYNQLFTCAQRNTRCLNVSLWCNILIGV